MTIQTRSTSRKRRSSTQYDSDLGADKDDDRVLRGRVRLHGAAKLPSGGCRSMTKGKETGGPFAFHAFVGICFFGGGLGRFPMKRKTRRLMGAGIYVAGARTTYHNRVGSHT